MKQNSETFLPRASLHDWFLHQWYQAEMPHSWLLPLESLFRCAVEFRQRAYKNGVRNSVRLPVPVLIVGNISVGGVGKTPLVIWLAEELTRRGYRPGIVSRGHGGRNTHTPQRVYPDSDPLSVGDEPVVMARRTGCPVVVAKKRVDAGQHLLATTDCTVVIADDGLQHYALARDVEIAVIDGVRKFGNGHCLPAGPLREPPERLKQVDCVIYNGAGPDGAVIMTLKGDRAINLADPTLSRPLADFRNQPTLALAGIGHPARFFAHLEQHGLKPERRVFPDHHAYRPDDLLRPADTHLLMTEKDAVKCGQWADSHGWYVPVEAMLPPGIADLLHQLLLGT